MAFLLMTDREEALRDRAFYLITDVTKQVITLSSGLIALGLTFWKDFATNSTGVHICLGISWGLLAGAVVFGIATLLSVTGQIANGNDDPNARALRGVAGIQIGLFAGGVVASATAGIIGLFA